MNQGLALQKAAVRKVAERYNSGRRLGFFSGMHLYRAFARASDTYDQFQLAETFVEGARGRAGKNAERIVERAASKSGNDSAKRLLRCFTRNERNCDRIPLVETSLETPEQKRQLAEKITGSIAFQTLANRLSSFVFASYNLAIASLATLLATMIYRLCESPGIEKINPAKLNETIAFGAVLGALIINLALVPLFKESEKALSWIAQVPLCVVCEHLKINARTER